MCVTEDFWRSAKFPQAGNRQSLGLCCFFFLPACVCHRLCLWMSVFRCVRKWYSQHLTTVSHYDKSRPTDSWIMDFPFCVCECARVSVCKECLAANQSRAVRRVSVGNSVRKGDTHTRTQTCVLMCSCMSTKCNHPGDKS